MNKYDRNILMTMKEEIYKDSYYNDEKKYDHNILMTMKEEI